MISFIILSQNTSDFDLPGFYVDSNTFLLADDEADIVDLLT